MSKAKTVPPNNPPTFKTHPTVAATGRPDYSEIERRFLEMVEIVNSGKGSDYIEGVRMALGWVVGAYCDPMEK